ncbi:NAD(P)-dependent oxidoreductase [Bradyrhizobium centrolobii]|nr:NAD(P)-dependent oxidoreductase [Bradyrhizobium centrolobii]
MEMSKRIETLGFVGLGVMGEPMCLNLTKKSRMPVYATDARPDPRNRLGEAGAKPCASIVEVAENADVIFLSLPSIAEVAEVCLGKEGILAANRRTHTVVDMSTSSVKGTRDLADKLRKEGLTLIDAPVARMRQAAWDGTLSIMVGGSTEDFDLVRPFLSHMGSDVTHCGGTGSGQVVKILNNMVVFMTVNALAEALAIGRRAGVDGALLFDVMSKGSADSFALRTPGLKALVPGNFPENTFPTDYAIKDIKLALELAEQGGIDAASAALTYDLLQKTSAAGYAQNYYPAMINLIEADRRSH